MCMKLTMMARGGIREVLIEGEEGQNNRCAFLLSEHGCI